MVLDTVTTICDKSEKCTICAQCGFHCKTKRPLEMVGTKCCPVYKDARLKAVCETKGDIFVWDLKNDLVNKPSYRDDIETIRSILTTIDNTEGLEALDRIK